MKRIICTALLATMYLSGLLLSLAVGYSAAECWNEEVEPSRNVAVCQGDTATFKCIITDSDCDSTLGVTRWNVNGSDCSVAHQGSDLSCSLHGSVNAHGHLINNTHGCCASTLRIHAVAHDLKIRCKAVYHGQRPDRTISEINLMVIEDGPSVENLTLRIQETGNPHTRNVTLSWEVDYVHSEAISNYTVTVDPPDPCNDTPGICVVSPHELRLEQNMTVRLGENYNFTVQGYSCDDRFPGDNIQSLQIMMQVAEAPSTCHVVPIYSVSNVGGERLKALEITWSSVENPICTNPCAHVHLAELKYVVKIQSRDNHEIKRIVNSSSCKSECYVAVTLNEAQYNVPGYSVSVTPKNAVGLGDSVNCTAGQQINDSNNFIRVWSTASHTYSNGTLICKFLSGATDESYCRIQCMANSNISVRIEGQSELPRINGNESTVTLQLPQNHHDGRYYCNISLNTIQHTPIARMQVPINFAGAEIRNAMVTFNANCNWVRLSCTLVEESVAEGCTFKFILANQTEQLFYISREDHFQCNNTNHHPEVYDIQVGVQWEPNGSGGITVFVVPEVIEETDVNICPCHSEHSAFQSSVLIIVGSVIGGLIVVVAIVIVIVVVIVVVVKRTLPPIKAAAAINGFYHDDVERGEQNRIFPTTFYTLRKRVFGS